MVKIKHKVIGLLIALGISIAIPMTIHADNQDVMDNANVLNDQTEQYIKQVNDKDLAKVKGHPQIAVITEKQVDGDIEAKAQQLFNKYQFGHKGYDNGVLLLIDVGDHKVRMQTGYGIEGAVPDDFVNQLMNDRVQNDFRKKDYSTGTRVMVGKLSKRIITHKSELRSKSDVNNHQAIVDQQNAKRKQIEHIIGYTILILIFTGWVVFLIYLVGNGIKKWYKKHHETVLLRKTIREVISVINAKLLDQHLANYQLSVDELPDVDVQTLKTGTYDLKPKLFTLFNLITINKLVTAKNRSYAFIEEDYSVEASHRSKELINILSLDEALDDYRVIADEIVAFEDDKNKLYAKLDNLDKNKLNVANNRIDREMKAKRLNFSHLTNKHIDGMIKHLSFDEDSFVSDLHRMISGSFGGTLLQMYLDGDSVDTDLLINDATDQLVSNRIGTIVEKLQDQNETAYQISINEAFDKRYKITDVEDQLDMGDREALSDLTLQDKIKLVNIDDDSVFMSTLIAILSAYELKRMREELHSIHNDTSYWEDDDDDDYHSHHHDHWNDDSGWGSGSGGFFGGSDNGGSFGGFGGFSGGSGGTAGW